LIYKSWKNFMTPAAQSQGATFLKTEAFEFGIGNVEGGI
jgi:hypothetical protein